MLNSISDINRRPLLERVSGVLLSAYLLTVSVQFLGIPGFGPKLQVPDLIFILLAVAVAGSILRDARRLWYSPCDVAAGAWTLANFAAAVQAGLDQPMALELAGSLYLLCLYGVVRLVMTDELLARGPALLAAAVLVAALPGILGSVLAVWGVETRLVRSVSHPYLVRVIQAQGLSLSPNMLASILMTGIIILAGVLFTRARRTRADMVLLAFILAGFALTLSKSIVCLAIGLLVAWHLARRGRSSRVRAVVVWSAVAGLAVVYVAATWTVVLRQESSRLEHLAGRYTIGPPIGTLGPLVLLPTPYLALAELSTDALVEAWPWGLGPGKFNEFVRRSRTQPAYEQLKRDFDPHSTYLGGLAEVGLMGGLALVCLVGVVGYGCRSIVRRSRHRGLAAGLAACWVAVAIEATTTDVMNFRHYWCLLGVTAALWHGAVPSHARHSDVAGGAVAQPGTGS